jgi:hypothetical protein
MAQTSSSSRFGRGFIINITYLAIKFSHSPGQAWMGAQDFFTEMIIPERFKGTEVEKLTDILRQKVIWHQAGGPMDNDQYSDVKRTISRLLVAIDRELGIADADPGRYHG